MFCLCLIPGFASAQAPGPGGPGGIAFPKPGADGAYAGDNYFQYINVPAPHTFEWGYRRGNPDHNREQYLSQKDHTFKAKLKWHDGYEGHYRHFIIIQIFRFRLLLIFLVRDEVIVISLSLK